MENYPLLNNIFKNTADYMQNMPKNKRKSIGQFFTSIETAIFMASMFESPTQEVMHLLDPGAGSGLLSAAAIDRLQNEDAVKQIILTCYEISSDVLPLLKSNLELLKKNSAKPLEFVIIEKNYITSQANAFNGKSESQNKYDWIIGNPPYLKISKDAVEAASMPSVCYGAPNLYFLFASMSLFNLDNNGEMVYIIPRSWTSGAYFKKFREYFLETGTLKHVHLFVSRDKVFKDENVLQETIIVKMNKSQQRDIVKVTSSQSNNDFHDVSTIFVPHDTIVFGEERYVYLVTNQEEIDVLRTMERLPNTLVSIGLKMKTGLTVDFRSGDYLTSEAKENTVPIFYSQHIKNGKVVFPINRENEYITTEKIGLLQRNKNYLFVKRFTSKEESRRLQSAIYLASEYPLYDRISTDNKVNFIESLEEEMTFEMAHGLYVIFNSTLYDSYYRILNGSTQVNSSEINAMPIPSLDEIKLMGRALMSKNDMSTVTCDNILEGLLL